MAGLRNQKSKPNPNAPSVDKVDQEMEHEVIVHQPQGGSAGTAPPAQSTQDKVIVIEKSLGKVGL